MVDKIVFPDYSGRKIIKRDENYSISQRHDISEGDTLFTSKGNAIILTKKVGEGGSKTGFLTDSPEIIALVYHELSLRNTRTISKLKYMTGVSFSVSDWPLDILYDQNNRFVGYTTKLIRGEALYSFFNKKELWNNYSRINEINIIISLCKAVKELHESNVIIGDLKPSNIFLSNGDVVIIGSDSMQIGEFPCSVYTAHFVDPCFNMSEIFSVYRSKEWDRFLLFLNIATIIFKGASPYSRIGAEEFVDASCGIFPYYLNKEESNAISPMGGRGIWSHLPTYIKKALINAGDKNRGEKYKLGNRYTPEEWIELFTRFKNDLESGALSSDPKANVAWTLDEIDYKLVDIE